MARLLIISAVALACMAVVSQARPLTDQSRRLLEDAPAPAPLPSSPQPNTKNWTTVEIPPARPAIQPSQAGWVSLVNVKKQIEDFKLSAAAKGGAATPATGSAAASLSGPSTIVDPTKPGTAAPSTNTVEAVVQAVNKGATTTSTSTPAATPTPAATTTPTPAATTTPTPAATTTPTPAATTTPTPAATTTPTPTPTTTPTPAPIVESPPAQPEPTPQPAPTPAPVAGGGCPDAANALAAMNAVRGTRGAAPLSWNADLAASAQAMTNNCVFEHSGSPFGENLMYGYLQDCTTAVNGWAGEAPNWHGGNDMDWDAGHFTQLVWKSTTAVGCGFTNCNGGTLVACHFNAPGNVAGQFAANV